MAPMAQISPIEMALIRAEKQRRRYHKRSDLKFSNQMAREGDHTLRVKKKCKFRSLNSPIKHGLVHWQYPKFIIVFSTDLHPGTATLHHTTEICHVLPPQDLH